ncbi:hypothetical protein [Priestia aryabhattai]|uniref:hypothetical protein n=1 Tax=Priestia aryabhattai TaxID=412384 RepID=UPI003D2B59E3
MRFFIFKINKISNRKAYKDKEGNVYLDCKHCGITPIQNFGEDKRGFMGKRSECNPCRRRTKLDRDKIGTKTSLTIKGKLVEVTHYKMSQARRYAYKDNKGEIYFVCTSCKDAKHIDYFYKDSKNGFFGRQSQCKTCVDIKNNEWDMSNKEYLKQKNEEWRELNRERIRKQRKEYRENNKRKIFLAKKRYREENKEKLYLKKKAYREANKEKEKERIKMWHKENPWKQRYYSQKRLARYKSLPNSLKEEQLETILNIYEHKCCLTEVNDYTLDHVIPLNVGHGGTTFENIIPLSRVLNGSKQDKNIFEWAESVYKLYGFTLERFNEVITEVARRNNMTFDEYRDYVYWCFKNKRSLTKDD